MPGKYFLPDLRFSPEQLESIDTSTKLADGITVGTFCNGITLKHIPNLLERKQLVRNLLPHAHIMQNIRANQNILKDYRLVVVEGLYKPGVEEELTPDGQKDLATKGRSIVYELRKNGITDNEKTYDLVTHLTTYFDIFDRIVLDYDTYNQGELNAQIIIDTPEIPSTYKVNFKKVVKTFFNNQEQASGELIDVTETPQTTIVIPAPEVDEVKGFFTVGDLHSRLLRVYGGDPWQSFALDGKTSKDGSIVANIKKISGGNTIVVSVGYNDIISSLDDENTIARRVRNIVNQAISQGLTTTYLLPPKTSKASISRQNKVRNAILSELSTFRNINIIDLDKFDIGTDGNSLTKASYVQLAQNLI